MFLTRLKEVWQDIDYPFFQSSEGKSFYFREIYQINIKGIENVNKGDVVALIGDFDLPSIATLLNLLEKGAIVVPLTSDTKKQHDYVVTPVRSHTGHCFRVMEETNLLTICISIRC